MIEKEMSKSKVGKILNTEEYHPIIIKEGNNWFKTIIKEDGYTFEGTLINTFLSLGALDCSFDTEKFLKSNSTEIPFEEFIKVLKNDKEWLSGPVIYGKITYYTGNKRYTFKVKEKETLDKIIDVICQKQEKQGYSKKLIEDNRRMLYRIAEYI